ncbi:MAG TPA: F0F1 ATP synthase subunit epsilon [Candidatus Limnocylindrales bacterium]|nr:F0F1 ATP synthase subunit epsilon [Candidatus Limnocylindrales bacterium]
MLLEIITPEKTVLNEEIDEILVPTEKGQIGILPHHINLITKLTAGEMIIRSNGKERALAVTGGFLEVKNQKVTVLADYAEHADKIDTDQALAAKNRAEEVLKNKDKGINEQDLRAAQSELRRALLQLHISENYRKKIHRTS